ncbi:thioesterase superfamily protein [Stemphylium lycopersici]|nr:thioesterase superfamily protein [Stemphylium lycopersici]
MTATSAHLQAFESMIWATLYLTSPEWIACDRDRGTEAGEDTDRFCRETTRANSGVRYWVELYEKPAPGARVTKFVSLIKFGTGLNGFPGICHGGALLTLMDEAMLHILVANTVLENGLSFMKVDEDYWRLQLHDGKSAQEVLKGRLATPSMNIKLLAPVQCPGIVGIETEVLENKGIKMKMRATMRDRQGKPLIQAEGLWVKIGVAAKL